MPDSNNLVNMVAALKGQSPNAPTQMEQFSTDPMDQVYRMTEPFVKHQVEGILDAVTLPGDVYAGREDPYNTQRTMGLAGLMLGAGAPVAQEGALGSAGSKIIQREALEKALKDKQGGFTNLGVPEGRDPNTGAYLGQVPKTNPGRAAGGQFQKHLDPYRNLPDINAETFGPPDITKPAPYRQGGRFTTQADYFRNRVPSPEEMTPVQQNQFYNEQNRPPAEDLNTLLQRIQQSPVGISDTPEVARWKSLIDELTKK